MPDSHETTLRVRYAETDKMGVVHHSSYVVYFEAARTEFMRSRGVSYAAMEDEGIMLAVIEVGIRYRASAFFDDLLSIATRLTNLTGATVEFAYQVWRDDPQDGEKRILVTEGQTTLACIDGRGRARRLPQHWRERLRDVLESDETAAPSPRRRSG